MHVVFSFNLKWRTEKLMPFPHAHTVSSIFITPPFAHSLTLHFRSCLPLQSICFCVEGGERSYVIDWRRTTTTLWILGLHLRPQRSTHHQSAPYGSAASSRDKREYFVLPNFSLSLSIIFPIFFSSVDFDIQQNCLLLCSLVGVSVSNLKLHPVLDLPQPPLGIYFELASPC